MQRNFNKLMRKRIYIHVFALLLLCAACKHQQDEPQLTPWGEEQDSLSADFDLEQKIKIEKFIDPYLHSHILSN